jgi:succinoglycan biosynthesis transport protein ExoP
MHLVGSDLAGRGNSGEPEICLSGGVGEHAVVNLRYLAGLRRGWIVIGLPVLAVALAVVWTARQDSTYASTTTLLVTQFASGGPPSQVHDIPASEELARTYGRLVVTSPVLERVIEELRLDPDVRQLKGRIDVSVGTASQLIQIRAEAPGPRRARTLAAVLARTFIASRAADRAHGARVTLAEPAQPAEEVGRNLLAAALLAAAFGGALAFGLVVGRDHILKPIDDPERLEDATGVQVLATIPSLRDGRMGRLGSMVGRATAASAEPDASRGDAELEPYRLLRTVVDEMLGQSPGKLILVTSPAAGDGVSTTVANLALAYAQLGRRILVVDCNLAAPTLHERLGLENDVGLADLLESGRTSNDAIQRASSGVALVSAGTPSRTPSDLLALHETKFVLEILATQFDLVLLDAPPAASVDSRVLSRLANRVLIVVDPRHSSVSSVEDALDSVDRESVLGVVLNRARIVGPHVGRTQAHAMTRSHRGRARHTSQHSDAPAATPQTASSGE